MRYAHAVSVLPSAPSRATRPSGRRLLTAELLSIGTELTVGDTRDTNSGDIARTLTARGVRVLRIQALPDDLDGVTDAFASAIGRADVVVSTGGLGPTPDDLTREALAALCRETPCVDPDLERWLRDLWARRGLPFPELNLKQAWLIPSATVVPNPNGTAPGWWIDMPDGRVIVALPGPPREMRPMWEAWTLPRLVERGLGGEMDQRTIRLSGIGESQAADLLGPALLGATNPSVATYARSDAVDVRIAAVPEAGRSAREVADAAEAVVLDRLGDHVWARGAVSWAEAIDAALDGLGWTLATAEAGTGGSFATLLSSARNRRWAEVAADPAAVEPPARLAALVTERAAAHVGCAVTVGSRGDDTTVRVAISTPRGSHSEQRLAFLAGDQGRARAALAAADILLRHLGTLAAPPGSGARPDDPA